MNDTNINQSQNSNSRLQELIALARAKQAAATAAQQTNTAQQPAADRNAAIKAALQARLAEKQAALQAAQPSNEVRSSITLPDNGTANSNQSSNGNPASAASVTDNPVDSGAANIKSGYAGGGFNWNPEQQRAIQQIAAGKSCVVVGSAGTGKTTLNREAIRLLSQAPHMPLLQSSDSTEILQAGKPGLVVVSYTNTAVNNIRKAIQGAATCSTIHKLLEFKPVMRESFGEDGSVKLTRVFEPARNRHNPLPENLRAIIIEEAGIVSIRLFEQLLDALPRPEAVQFIFLGDLFQLDPPYDAAILGYAMDFLETEVIELTTVYRQALESPILKFAIDVKEGKTWGSQHFADLSCSDERTGSSLTIKPWKHRIDSFKATQEAAKFIKKEWLAGRYDPERSSIILPFGAAANSKDKEAAFGSLNLNKLIADFLGEARGAIIHEVIAGFSKVYLAIGDHVVVNKIRGKITKIERNGAYLGKISPKHPSAAMDRFGHIAKSRLPVGSNAADELAELRTDKELEEEIDRLLAAAESDNAEVLRNASHVVTVQLEDDWDTEVELRSAGDFSFQKFDFSYAQTCYKAQGSEYNSVYVFTHKSHAVMLCNEFFYTASTRAKQHLVLICEPDHLMNAVKKQAIPGRDWRSKLSYFQSSKKKESLLPFENIVTWGAMLRFKTMNAINKQGD